MPGAVPLDLLLFLLAAFLGALIADVAGIAFGLVASAIWLHAITPAQSAALIAAFAILIQAATLWKTGLARPKLPIFLGGPVADDA